MKSAAEWSEAFEANKLAPTTDWLPRQRMIRAIQADAIRWAAEQQRESDAKLGRALRIRGLSTRIRHNALVQLPKEGE